ncbi:hypothetical protein RvY_10794 [Ramazzottius varieornatus]|uniref:Thioredoxin n=1 Tax=Ramazzottius varieornatus TaxID=947166 RepID=A0A1D1VDX6_RAMVA|nr:hypothetical protein RvY_10794 [Ramazzottius varieornatus]
MGDHGNVKIVTDKSDLEKILKDAGGKLVIIDFSAKWCGPCKNIHPKYTALSSQYSDAVFLTVDVDDAEEIAAAYDVSSMPTFVFVKNGKSVERFSGANPTKLEEMINKLK